MVGQPHQPLLTVMAVLTETDQQLRQRLGPALPAQADDIVEPQLLGLLQPFKRSTGTGQAAEPTIGQTFDEFTIRVTRFGQPSLFDHLLSKRIHQLLAVGS